MKKYKHHFLTYLQRILTYCKQRQAPNFRELTLFLRQFATLLASGIPVIQSCLILEKSQEKITLRLLIYAIKREILAGHSLHISLAKHPHYFDALTCHLIQIGEHTGKLDTLLLTIAADWEQRLLLKNRIKQAMFYPILISITAFFVIIGMMIFVIPRFAELFENSDVILPRFTQWLFYLSKQTQYIIAYGCLLLTLSRIFLYRNNSWKNIFLNLKNLILKLPLLKSAIHKIRLAHFAKNLALTFAAGIPIIDSLRLMAQSNDNEFNRILRQLRHRVSSGMPLHIAMASFPAFPMFMIQMVKIGEESGSLDLMLNKTSAFLEADIQHFFSRLQQLLEPLIMVVLGVLIGGLVIGMYLPVFKLGNAL